MPSNSQKELKRRRFIERSYEYAYGKQIFFMNFSELYFNKNIDFSNLYSQHRSEINISFDMRHINPTLDNIHIHHETFKISSTQIFKLH